MRIGIRRTVGTLGNVGICWGTTVGAAHRIVVIVGQLGIVIAGQSHDSLTLGQLVNEVVDLVGKKDILG